MCSVAARATLHSSFPFLWLSSAVAATIWGTSTVHIKSTNRAHSVVLHRPYHAFLGAQVHHP
eukprot:6310770-Alexandrium_andersonii.AAC.1